MTRKMGKREINFQEIVDKPRIGNDKIKGLWLFGLTFISHSKIGKSSGPPGREVNVLKNKQSAKYKFWLNIFTS